MTMDKAQETKLQRYKVSVSVFSADISKSEDIKYILRSFSKIPTIVYYRDSCSFQQWVQQEAKQRILQDWEGNTQTHTHIPVHTQIHYYNAPSAYAQVIYDTVLTNQVRTDEMIL